MDELQQLGLLALVLLLLIVTLLCGQNPLLARTPLPRMHRLLMQDLPDGAAAAARRLGGRRATAALAATAEACCERSNPVVQVIFVVLLVGSYTLFSWHIFPMLPLPGLPAWHKYTGTAAALACLALFVAASLSDPGTITPANLAAHLALYPPDGVWYREKTCGTCNLQRPARSKHCSVCGRCIARLDHHCIWINGCVGLLNMRHFLAFLLATGVVCMYGAVLGVQAIRSDMRLHRTWDVAFRLPGTEQVVRLADSRRFTFRYVSAAYGPQAAVTFFAGCCGLIVLGFLTFQLCLIATGLTTVELHKRKEMEQAQAGEAEAAQEDGEAQQMLARVDAVLAGGLPQVAAMGADQRAGPATNGKLAGTGDAAENRAPLGAGPAAGSSSRAATGQRQQRARPFDRGVWRNLGEVLFPHRYLHLAAAAGAGGGNGKKRA